MNLPGSAPWRNAGAIKITRRPVFATIGERGRWWRNLGLQAAQRVCDGLRVSSRICRC